MFFLELEFFVFVSCSCSCLLMACHSYTHIHARAHTKIFYCFSRKSSYFYLLIFNGWIIYGQISCFQRTLFVLMAFYFISSRRFSFFADPKNRYKRPDSHENMVDALGMLDFPRKSFVQITERVSLSFSLSSSVVRNIIMKKEYKIYYICVSYYMISLSPENVLSAVKNWRRPVDHFCRKLFQILRKFMFDTY